MGIFHNERVKPIIFMLKCLLIVGYTGVVSPEMKNTTNAALTVGLSSLTVRLDRNFVPRFHAVPATLSYSAEALTGRSLVFDSRMI